MPQPIAIWWLRRDLRLADNAALFHALGSGLPVLPLFIFDTDILQHLPRTDARVGFIHDSLGALKNELCQQGSDLLVRVGTPQAVWAQLLSEYNIGAVYTNEDYEPYAKTRDAAVGALLGKHGATLHAYKDQVIFARDEVLTGGGMPYRVFTPYKNAWLQRLLPAHLAVYASDKLLAQLLPVAQTTTMPTLAQLGFSASTIQIPASTVADALLKQYAAQRDIPGVEGTSRLGVHLRFGTISIRALARQAQRHSAVFLNELIWRDFYAMLLHHYPHVVNRAFKPEYDRIPWRFDEHQWQRWCTGTTGYPMVDAGMRQLNQTGYMHNRVRMVVASFLTKHLLHDWRLGQDYFARLLLDYELASNNGGWQWAAGTGADAAPYFRIFNPSEQLKKFDPQLQYVRQWVPEYGTTRYPQPVVAHAQARALALATYKAALAGG